jgi:hypothetical protein
MNGSLKAVAIFALVVSGFAPRTRAQEASEAFRMSPGARTNQSAAPSYVDAPSFGLIACGLAATVSSRDVSARSMPVQLSLAMADFTGDSHPDLATVELDRLDSSHALYFIEIQLTEGGRQSLELEAPVGGVYITPKDVTGDGTLDLIVRATASRSVVAVFLNDGCGRFSRGEPESLAHISRSALPSFEFTANQPRFTALAIAQWSHQIESQDRSGQRLREKRASAACREIELPAQWTVSFCPNRAPPAVS